MADPTTGSWGLGPLGAASTSTMPLAAPSTLTPGQVALMRQHAMALQEPPQGGIHHWTQGLAELVKAIQGNREADFARQAENAGRSQGAEAISSIYSPYLSPGGASPPAAGAAPAGTPRGAPAGAIPSSDETGSPLVAADASAPRGIRNNNPLNIEDGDFARSQPGYAGTDGRFAKFQAPEHGTAAANALLDNYQKNHGLNTVSGIVGRWAPKSDGNDTKAYAADVASRMGIGPDDPIPPEMRSQLVAAMARHENGQPMPSTPPTAARPTGLLAPIQPSSAPQRVSSAATPIPLSDGAPNAVPIPNQPGDTAPPVRLAYAGDGPIPEGMLPDAITKGSQISPSPASPPVPPAAPSAFDTGAAPDPMAGLASSSAMSPGTLSPDAGRYGSLTPMINAISGKSGGFSPDDFKRQVAAMEAAKQTVTPTTAGIAPPGGEPWTPQGFMSAANAMEAGKANPGQPNPAPSDGGSPPLTPTEQAMMALVRPGTNGNPPLTPTEQQMMAMVGGPASSAAAVPPAAAPSAAPTAPSPVPLLQPRPPMPPAFLLPGSAIPGAVGPTSVNGAPLVPPGSSPPLALPPPFGATSVNGAQLPQSGGGQNPMVDAIAGRTAPSAQPIAAPSAVGGAPNPPAPIRVAQNGPPTSIAPVPSGGPSGLPQPLTSPVGQITQDQLTRTLANPWVPDSAKAAMLQMIQQRGQPQTMPVEGGTMMFNAAGQKVFIPEPKFGTVKIGSAEVPTVSHFDPASGRWNTTTLAPGGGVQTGGGAAGNGPLPHPAQGQGAPNEPDLSTIGGIQANEAAQAGAKKAAEAGGEATAKYYDSLHKGLAGSAMIAAQQKQNIDMLRQVAASPNFTPGAGSEAALGLQRIAAAFGINPEGAAPRELFNQVATRILADQISGIKSMASETGETGGRIFKSMLDLEEKANITPEDTAAGINAKINLIDHAGDLMMKWGDMADDYVKEHGKLDPGFDKTLRKEISAARIPNAVPKAAPNPPAQSDIEAEMRKRGLLQGNQSAAPVSQ